MDQPSPLTGSLLTPILALAVWSLVMLAWTYAVRIPAIRKAGIDPNKAQEPTSLDALPLKVRQVAHNYNHLMEQPTIFYALAVYTYLAGQQNGLNIALAWAYVAIRVIHSLVQATVNVVLLRFSIFICGSLVLAVLAGRDVWALFAG
ncbi:MAG TPA: MAPEG family protein [Caulobacteraceae bacterium]|nr:MAPEG family protein [Caulobacteraceae bacterium]